MKKTLTTNEINEIVADTIERIEAKKVTNSVPYIQMDLSAYSLDTIEALKEAFVASNIHFEDRWNDGSDFIVNVPVECAPEIFRSGRRDVGTVDPRNPMRDSVHLPKTPSHLGRRDTGTVDPRNPMRDSVHQPKTPSLDNIIKEATSKANSTPVNNRDTYEMKEIY